MSRLLIKGQLFDPVKIGDVGDWYEHDPNCSCGDCGRHYGEQHIAGCDIERCPSCGGQLISCGCGAIYDVPDEYTEKQINELIDEQKLENKRLAEDRAIEM